LLYIFDPEMRRRDVLEDMDLLFVAEVLGFVEVGK